MRTVLFLAALVATVVADEDGPTITVVSTNVAPAAVPAGMIAAPAPRTKRLGDECPQVNPDVDCAAPAHHLRRRLQNINAILNLEDMENQIWDHIPDQSMSPGGKIISGGDQEHLVQKYFWDYMAVWDCIQVQKRDPAQCVEEQKNSMHMLMGGVINGKFWTTCEEYKPDYSAPLSVCDIKRIGQCCWAGINEQQSQRKMVYQIFDMRVATHCVNQPGGSVCRCSAEFNQGIISALQGAASEETQKEIFSKLMLHYC